MTKNKGRIRLGAAALLALTTLMMPVQPVVFSRTRSPASATAPVIAECEGDACSQVTVAFDESKQQYHAQNNSADHWARVTASNTAASASACIAPGREAYLPLKSIAGAYHAEYAGARCGEPEPSGPPGGE